MRILYGVSGEGYGHAIRSKEIIDQLKEKHEILVVAGGKAYIHLKKYFKIVKIDNHFILYKNNSVRVILTFIFWFVRMPLIVIKNIKLINIKNKFKPDLIITDFEPLTCYLANVFNIPCISIDNQHITTNTYVKVKRRIMDKFNSDIVIRAMIPKANKYLVTTFFYPKIKDKSTYLIPPIIKKEILDSKPKKGRHVLVYQTSKTYYQQFLPILKMIDEKFIIYGLDEESKDENLIFKKFNKHFVKDLAESKAVITNGGLTLIYEAIYLQKPVLSVPVKKHFEQYVNSQYLEKLGYGKCVKELTKKNIEDFLNNLDKYKINLMKYKNKEFDVNELIESNFLMVR